MKKLFILASLFLIACGPSKEELDAQKKEKNNEHIQNVYVDDSYRIVKIDNCEYIILRGATIIHKANCYNHPNQVINN